MEESIFWNTFTIRCGEFRDGKIYPDKTGMIRLFTALPQDWKKYTYCIVSAKVEAEDKPVNTFRTLPI